MSKLKKRPEIYQHPELDGKSFFLEGDKDKDLGLLFIHGFTATTVEVRQIANYFYNNGYTVSAPLLPGHGETPRDLNRVRLSDWINKVEESYSLLRIMKGKVIVMGESMGALLALNLAFSHPEITKLFLFSPALEIKRLGFSRFLWPFVPYIYKKNTDESMAWQGYNVVPLHAANELLKLQKLIINLLPRIKVPATIFLGKKDQTISLPGGVKTYDLLGSSEKELIWLEESSHCIILDKELNKVIEMVSASIEQKI
ncbi:MAG: alpha/beta fold hydrolase [Candidatus Atribacteria bacterium]|nr:alpha/beta fold hydrolase [Candidatus Atribacteria bacterium]